MALSRGHRGQEEGEALGLSHGGLDVDFLSTSVGYVLKRAYLRIRDDFIKSLSDFDLRPQLFSVLSVVVENPNCSQSEVARALSIERSNMVLLVDELVRRGLLTKNAVATDRRLSALRPTDGGKRLHAAAMGRIVAHENRIFAEWTNEERQILVGLLNRVGASGQNGATGHSLTQPSGNRKRAHG
jgi:DNA-binding MarR family transcriptional regulator